MGDVKVTVRVAWFNKSPRPSMGTVAHTTRSASPVMEAVKLWIAKLKSKSGLFSQ